MTNKSKTEYERYLNQLYADIYGWGEVEENFSHYKCTKATLLSAYHNHTLGTLQRKHDPIAFNVGFGEWERM